LSLFVLIMVNAKIQKFVIKEVANWHAGLSNVVSMLFVWQTTMWLIVSACLDFMDQMQTLNAQHVSLRMNAHCLRMLHVFFSSTLDN
jgi:hypothetical protein